MVAVIVRENQMKVWGLLWYFSLEDFLAYL